jgi:hypothetical protein
MGWNWKGELPVQILFDSPDSLLAGFISPGETGRLLLVTNPIRAGMTLKRLELAERAQAWSVHASGVGYLALLKGISIKKISS